MKNSITILFLIFSLNTINCQNTPIKKSILRNSEITFMVIDAYQTEPELQKDAWQYILNYKILGSILLSDTSLVQVINELKNNKNFGLFSQRRCPFLAKYAIRISKNKKSKSLIFSDMACPKVLTNTGNGSLTTYDLRDDSDLITLLKSFEKNLQFIMNRSDL
jgi:hypothetical protein